MALLQPSTELLDRCTRYLDRGGIPILEQPACSGWRCSVAFRRGASADEHEHVSLTVTKPAREPGALQLDIAYTERLDVRGLHRRAFDTSALISVKIFDGVRTHNLWRDGPVWRMMVVDEQDFQIGKYSIFPDHSSWDVAVAINSRSCTIWPVVTRS